MNSLLASRTRRIVVIADSSKLGENVVAHVCPTEKVSRGDRQGRGR